MPRLTKSGSAAIAAFVVSVAAAAASLTSVPGAADVPASQAATSATRSQPEADRDVDDAAVRSVLFVGRSPDLNPRGGTARSFACLASSRLGWRCHVRQNPSRGLPAQVDAVVIALVPEDDAARLAQLLDALPARMAGAPVVVLQPIESGATRATQQRRAAVRQLSRERGALVIDPVAQQWIVPGSREVYLADVGRLTTAGHERAAERLAQALAQALNPPR